MNAEIIKESAFNRIVNGRQVALINLTNARGSKVQVTNYGARVVSFLVKDGGGVLRDIIIGHKDIDGYLNSQERYFNAIIGPYAGRIAAGKFNLNGKEYRLDTNNGGNHLHGGAAGFNEIVWEVFSVEPQKIKLRHFFKGGATGYPADIEVIVKYTLTDADEFVIDYTARAGGDTPFNPTNHMFFNLGEHSGNVLNQRLMINAEEYLPLDENSIPAGAFAPVKDTPFDFRVLKEIGADILKGDARLKQAKGYDHSFKIPAFDGRTLRHAATVYGPQYGLMLKVSTTEPSVHFYSGNYLLGKDTGKYGANYKHFGAFCLETQHYPDSPNKPQFPSAVIKGGQLFTSSTVYKVEAIK